MYRGPQPRHELLSDKGGSTYRAKVCSGGRLSAPLRHGPGARIFRNNAYRAAASLITPDAEYKRPVRFWASLASHPPPSPALPRIWKIIPAPSRSSPDPPPLASSLSIRAISRSYAWALFRAPQVHEFPVSSNAIASHRRITMRKVLFSFRLFRANAQSTLRDAPSAKGSPRRSSLKKSIGHRRKASPGRRWN
jgi:hypothetical protein